MDNEKSISEQILYEKTRFLERYIDALSERVLGHVSTCSIKKKAMGNAHEPQRPECANCMFMQQNADMRREIERQREIVGKMMDAAQEIMRLGGSYGE